MSAPSPTPQPAIRRPILARQARYRWDAVRSQHQLMFAEGVLVLNEAGAAIVQQCDGKTVDQVIAALNEQFPAGVPAGDVQTFLARLFDKGLLREAEEPRP